MAMAISLPRLLLIALVLAAGNPAAGREIRTFQDLRYDGVARQGGEPSCAAASVATILNNFFGESFEEADLWLQYLNALEPHERKLAMQDGLSIADILKLVGRLGYQGHAVRISLMDLARTARPAIIYMERAGRRDYRHFLVFDRLDGTRAVLRDPAVGNRRVHIEHFLSEWRGHAIFITQRE